MLNQHTVYWEPTLNAWVVKNDVLSTYGEEVVFTARHYSGSYLFVRKSEAHDPSQVETYSVFERSHLFADDNERRVSRLVRFEMDGTVSYE